MATIDSQSQATTQDPKGNGAQAESAGTQPAPEGQSPQNGGPGHIIDNASVNVVTQPDVASSNGNAHASASGDTAPVSVQVPSSNPQQAQLAPPTPSSSATRLRTDDSEKAKDAGGDRASTSEQSHRRKAGVSTSSDLHTASTAAEKPTRSKAASKRAKPSFFSKLIRVLVPCAGPSKAHEVDLDISKVQPPVPPAPVVVETRKLQPVAREPEAPLPPPTKPEPLVVPPAPVEEPSQPEPSEEPEPPRVPTPTPPAPPPLQPIDIPPPSDDPSVVVPPTPTKLLSREETEGMTSGAVQPPGSTGEEVVHEHHRRDSEDSDGSTSFTDDEEMDGPLPADQEEEDEEERLIMNGGAGIPIGPDGQPRPLLPPISPKHQGRKCLVLDLDETLVHSSFKSIQQADYVVPVEIEYHWHNVYVIKRPGVDNFLKKMGEIYEVVVFTASLSKYADPVLDKLDIHHVVSHRLFRESCYNHRGNYVKDLSQLGRPIADTIIIDNSPASYIFHPNNAVPVSSWFNDPHDTELTDLVPFLTDLGQVEDVRGVLDGGL